MCPLVHSQFIGLVFFLAFLIGILINTKIINIVHNIYFVALVIDLGIFYLLKDRVSVVMKLEYKLLIIIAVFLIAYLVRPLFKQWNKYMLFNYSSAADDSINRLSDKFGVEIKTEVSKAKDWSVQLSGNYNKNYVREINEIVRKDGKTSVFSALILVVLLGLAIYFYVN
ncbi:MAG: hypothetical protein CSB16_00690 [Clostridiales bacterium]|nr:MAG: hypothetical protein CSB16_00690 [Clostridiales bacterium]